MVGGPTDIVVESGILRGGQRTLSPVGNAQPAMDESPQLPLDVAPSTIGRAATGEATAEGAPEPAGLRRSEAHFTPLPDLRNASAGDRRKPAASPPPAAPLRDPLGSFRREAPAATEKPSAERPGSTDIGDLAGSSGLAPRPAPPPTARPPEPAQPVRPVTSPLPEPRPGPSRPDAVQSSPARPSPVRAAPARPDPANPGLAATDSEPMSAMARELERALQRPFSSVRPNTPAATAPGPTPPPRPSTSSEPAGAASSQPIGGATPQAAGAPAGAARPRSTAPNAPWDQLSAVTKRPAPSDAGTVAAPPTDPAPAHSPSNHSPANPATAKSEASVSVAEATPAKKPDVDPFSVDDIEAEFARLLGRTPPTR